MNKGNGGKPLTKTYEKQLSVREIVLIDLLVNPIDNRSKEDKAIEAGYKNGKYVFELIRKPYMAQAIRQRCDDLVSSLVQLQRIKVIQAVADRAISKSALDARTFLQISDDLVTTPNIHVTQTTINETEARESRKERLGGLLKEREIIPD